MVAMYSGGAAVGGLNKSAAAYAKERGGHAMHQYPWEPILSVVAGILVLIAPKILNYTVAVYLIIIGLLGLVR